MKPETPLPGFPNPQSSVAQLAKAIEVVYGAHQPQYFPLPSIVFPGAEGEVLTRWQLSEEEIEALKNGASLYLTLLTFGNPLQPVRLDVATPEQIVARIIAESQDAQPEADAVLSANELEGAQ